MNKAVVRSILQCTRAECRKEFLLPVLIETLKEVMRSLGLEVLVA